MPRTEPVALPRAHRAPRHITLQLSLAPDARGIKITCPHARGWAKLARNPLDFWAAMREAFNETAIAGYARYQGQEYDLSVLTDADDPDDAGPAVPVLTEVPVVSYAKGAITRPDVTDPAAWTPLPDGRTWLSPGGRRLRHPSKVGPIIAKRANLGLPTSYADLPDDDQYEARRLDAATKTRDELRAERRAVRVADGLPAARVNQWSA